MHELAPSQADRPSSLSGGRGRHADTAFRWVATLGGASVLALLAWMILSTSADAWPVLRKEGLGFLLGDVWQPGSSRTEITGTYQARSFLWGTVYTSAIALVLAVPLAVGVALYLSELAPPRVRALLTNLVDLLAGIPSIVYGLWGVIFLLPLLRPVMQLLADTAGRVLPWLFGGPVQVRSYWLAGVVLGIMILPIISAVSREVIAGVPVEERHAAYGLGATRWEVIRHVVLPRARAGIIGATMLGLGRALGETIAVMLLIGGSANLDTRLFGPGQTIAGQIASQFRESSPEAISGLVALGVALFGLTVLVNVGARAIVARTGRIPGGSAL